MTRMPVHCNRCRLVRRIGATLIAAAVVAGPLAPLAQSLVGPSRVVAPAVDPAAAVRRTMPLLKLESRGEDVVWVQRRVNVTADGIFGPRTRQAVIDFQKRNRLAPDGIVGPLTLGALNAPSASCIVSGPMRFRNDWGEPRSGGRTHKGTDVFAPYGAPIRAIADGVVVRAHVSGLGGRSITLRVGNVHYYYAHNSQNLVRPGQHVKAGELIGRVGNSGNAAGGPAHIHFARWEGPLGNHRAVNPYRTLLEVC